MYTYGKLVTIIATAIATVTKNWNLNVTTFVATFTAAGYEYRQVEKTHEFRKPLSLGAYDYGHWDFSIVEKENGLVPSWSRTDAKDGRVSVTIAPSVGGLLTAETASLLRSLSVETPVETGEVVFLKLPAWMQADIGQCCEWPEGAWVLRAEAVEILDTFVVSEKERLGLIAK
jgi:hypothetical protein